MLAAMSASDQLSPSRIARISIASVSGPPDSLQRALPVLADTLGERIRVLRALRRSDRPPPHWQVPTAALQAYSRALLHLDRGDTTGAVALLRETLKGAPGFMDACDTLKRVSATSSCAR